jgi:hypothetical protein
MLVTWLSCFRFFSFPEALSTECFMVFSVDKNNEFPLCRVWNRLFDYLSVWFITKSLWFPPCIPFLKRFFILYMLFVKQMCVDDLPLTGHLADFPMHACLRCVNASFFASSWYW